MWSKQDPRLTTKFPGTRPHRLDVAHGCGFEASLQSACVQAQSYGQSKPRDVFNFQEHLQKKGLVYKSGRVGVRCPLGQISQLTRQIFSGPGGTGAVEEGL